MTDSVDRSTDLIQSLLARSGLELRLSPAADEATLVREADGAAAVMVSLARMTAPVITAAAASGCRLIVRCGVGVDNIDLEAARRHEVQVANVPDYCVGEVADHTVALLLASARDLIGQVTAVSAGGWDPRRRPIHRLRGSTLALLGYGRIGREVGRRARALGMRVRVHDPLAHSRVGRAVSFAASLEDAVRDADYVSLHLPLTAETRHVINGVSLAAMTRSPVVINTSL